MLASTVEIRKKMSALVEMLVKPYSDASLDKMILLFEEIKIGVANTTDAYRVGYFHLDIANFLAKELRVNPDNEKARNYLNQIIKENLEQVKCIHNPILKLKIEFFGDQPLDLNTQLQVQPSSISSVLNHLGGWLFQAFASGRGEQESLVGNKKNVTNYGTINS